jgi:hypothetical protein
MPVIFTTDEILAAGLELFKFDGARQRSVCRKQNIDRFKTLYGSLPCVCAQIWDDLQSTHIQEARIHVTKPAAIKYFFMTLHFLKAYPKAAVLAGTFRVSERTVGPYLWSYIAKMQALKEEKVFLPAFCTSAMCSVLTIVYSPNADSLARLLDDRQCKSE